MRYAPPERPPQTHAELQALESYFRALDGYIWLSQRFEHTFIQAEKAERYRVTCAKMIEAALFDLPPLPGIGRDEHRRAREAITRVQRVASAQHKKRGNRGTSKRTVHR